MRRLWEATESEYLPATRHPSSRWSQSLWVVAMLLLLPAILLLRPLLRRWILHKTAAEKIEAEARERWSTNPHDALVLLKEVCSTLHLAKHAGRIKIWRGSVEVPPHGRFRLSDSVYLDGVLYACAYKLGDYEAALDACSQDPLSLSSIQQQVSCLVAMHRHQDAIALLQRSLHLDNRHGDLHRRLGELSRDLLVLPSSDRDRSN